VFPGSSVIVISSSQLAKASGMSNRRNGLIREKLLKIGEVGGIEAEYP
jgi:hypothetical protein